MTKSIILVVVISVSIFRVIAQNTESDILENESSILLSTTANSVSKAYGADTIILKRGTQKKNSLGVCVPNREIIKRTAEGINSRNCKIQFDLKFDKSFDFDRGGKVGYGMRIGQGVTGCKGILSKENKGGSFRIMWRGKGDKSVNDKCTIDNVDTKKAEIIPYLYYRYMKGVCGNNLGKSFDIDRGKWYTVVMTFKANNKSNKDGRAKLEVGESGKPLTIVLDKKDIVWSNNISNQTVTAFYYHFFRGGADANWASRKDGKIYMRNVTLEYEDFNKKNQNNNKRKRRARGVR